MDTPKKGTIAVNEHGFLGIITETEPRDVDYGYYPQFRDAVYNTSQVRVNDPCFTTNAYIGIHISEEHLGQPWISVNPTVVEHVSDICSRLPDSECKKK